MSSKNVLSERISMQDTESQMERLRVGNPAQRTVPTPTEAFKQIEWFIGMFASYLSRSCSAAFEDLRQEGVLGMIRAIEKYDPEVSSFGTYAQHWVKAYMYSWAYKNSYIIQIPEDYHLIYVRYQTATSAMSKKEIREQLPELAKELKTTVNRLKRITTTVADLKNGCSAERVQCSHAGSIRTSLNSDDSNPVKVEQRVHDSYTLKKLKEVITPVEYFVLDHLLALETPKKKTLGWVGKIMGITREGVRQIKNKALEKWRLKIETETKDGSSTS